MVVDVLATALDWKFQFDIHAPDYNQVKSRMFPSEILEVSQMPDGVIWSCSTKVVIWIELTVPWEENMTLCNAAKKLNTISLN